MEKTKLEIFREAAEWLSDGGFETEVRDDYSGRGMYGRTCPAIVTDAPPTFVGFAVGLACEDMVDVHDMIPAREDSMGLRRVFY